MVPGERDIHRIQARPATCSCRGTTQLGVLAERLQLVREQGASLALAKARAETSGPILLRADFTDFGQQRRYRLTLG